MDIGESLWVNCASLIRSFMSRRSSRLYSLRQVTEVKLGRVRSDAGWVTSEVWPHNSPRRPSEGTLN